MTFINATQHVMPYNTGNLCGVILPRSNKFLKAAQIWRKLVSTPDQPAYALRLQALRNAAAISLQAEKPCASQSNKATSETALSIFSDHKYTFLQHKTTLERLPSILSMGALVTGEKVPFPESGVGYGENRPGKVFFHPTRLINNPTSPSFHSECWSPEWGKGFEDLEVTLLFNLSLLESGRYHVLQQGMNYGNYDSRTDYHHSQPLSKLKGLLAQCGKEVCGEVVLYQDAPVSKLCAIWVHPANKGEVVSYLLNSKITEINNIFLDKFINRNFGKVA